ncbi:MAG TPA: hypothetical protein VLM42_19565 [Bryobacteraceae bacterium]|nr:hypothetical protein [Bryobacteraceae bacterium]
MVRLVLAAVAFVPILAPSAQTGKTAEAPIPTFTVCEILAQRVEYDGKMVRIRASIFGTDEGVWFVGDCPGVVSTDGHVWPSTISMQVASSEMAPSSHDHPVNFASDYRSEKKLWPKLRRIGRKVPEECVIWTYTGLFETRDIYPKVTYPKAPPAYIGFGQASAAPAQLIWKTAEDVNVDPNCHLKTRGQK